MPQNKNEFTKISKETNTQLCRFLLSPQKAFGIRTYKCSFSPKLVFPEPTEKVANRLKYLKRIQAKTNPPRFSAICFDYDIKAASPPEAGDEASEANESDTSSGEETYHSSPEEEAGEEQSPPPSHTPTPPTSRPSIQPPTPKMTSTATTKYDIGKVIVCKPDKETYFTMYWLDQKLDKIIMEVIIQSRRAILRTKKPEMGDSAKEDAIMLLEDQGYDFVHQTNHTTVEAFAQALGKIKKRMDQERDNGWLERVICEYPEDVLTKSVNEKGKSAKVKYDRDSFG
jgi:hypothetical protein